MKQRLRVFITDCEGPISKNDNAFELTSLFVPDGDHFFTLISRYDDVLADILKKPGYKAGDTLRLILPFLRAYGATNDKMRAYSARNILLVPGADETLRFATSIMPSFIVSTSYEHYISALCDTVGFQQENAYCTRLNIDRYELGKEEAERLKALREEISKLPMIEIPKGAKSLHDLPSKTKTAAKTLDHVFWEEFSEMESGRMLGEVNPVGGFEKANAGVNCLIQWQPLCSKRGRDCCSVLPHSCDICLSRGLQEVRQAARDRIGRELASIILAGTV